LIHVGSTLFDTIPLWIVGCKVQTKLYLELSARQNHVILPTVDKSSRIWELILS